MVQKDKFRSENFCKKLILALLIIFTVPLPANSESQIPSRKDCSLLKKKQITKNALLKFDPDLAKKYISIGEPQIRFKVNDYRPYHFK